MLYTKPSFDVAANGTNGAGNNTATSLSWSHTTGSGTNRFLIVTIHYTVIATSMPSVSGITYNGVAMTHFATVLSGSTSTDRGVELWYLANPASGSNTVAATLSASGIYWSGVSTTWSNATPSFGTAGTSASGSGTTGTVTEAESANDLFYGALCVRTSSAPTASTGTVPANGTNSSASNCFAAVSYQTGSTTAVSATWTWSPSDNFAMIGVPVFAAIVPGSSTVGDGAVRRAAFY